MEQSTILIIEIESCIRPHIRDHSVFIFQINKKSTIMPLSKKFRLIIPTNFNVMSSFVWSNFKNQILRLHFRTLTDL